MIEITEPVPAVALCIRVAQDTYLPYRTRLSAVGVVHNLISIGLEVDEFKVRSRMAEEGVLDAVRQLLDPTPGRAAEDNSIRLLSAMIIANLAGTHEGSDDDDDEDGGQRATVMSNAGQCTDLLVEALQMTLNYEETEAGRFSVRELMQSVKQLSMNKSNFIQLIVRDRALPLLAEALESHGKEHGVFRYSVEVLLAALYIEDVEAAEVVKKFFFDSETQMFKKIQSLVKQLLADVTVEDISWETRMCAWYIIEKLDEGVKDSETAQDTAAYSVDSKSAELSGAATKEVKHVMASYCHKQKERVKEIVEELRNKGLLVWRDEEGTDYCPRMKDSSVETMARAVEMSYTVICFVSREYFNSQACKKEVRCYLKITISQTCKFKA